MPCNSDHMEPTGKERYLQRTAKLYLFAMHAVGAGSEAVERAASDIYGTKDYTKDLCELLTDLKKRKLFDSVVYNAKSRVSRDLADWWEAHQQADLEKARAAHLLERDRELVKSATAKLTPAELAALRRKL